MQIICESHTIHIPWRGEERGGEERRGEERREWKRREEERRGESTAKQKDETNNNNNGKDTYDEQKCDSNQKRNIERGRGK